LPLNYNDYADLRTGRFALPFQEEGTQYLVLPLDLVNLMTGKTYGIEAVSDWRPPQKRWRLRAAYTFLKMQLHAGPGVDQELVSSAVGESPQHQFYVWSSIDLPNRVWLDGLVRYVDRLSTPAFDSYVEFDARLAWEAVDKVEVALVGRNLLAAQHP